MVISGPEALEIGVTATFSCSAECIPSCSFTWLLYGTTVTGRAIDITVNRHVSQEFISCQAENTVSGMTAAVNETLSVSGMLLVDGSSLQLVTAHAHFARVLPRSSLVWMLRQWKSNFTSLLCTQSNTHMLW